MLACIAVPKSILSELLPPFTCEASQRAAWLDGGFELSDRACDIDRSKCDAVVVHSAGHQFIVSFGLVGEGTLGRAVLVLEFGRVGAIPVIVIAAELAS